ncbi:MAG: phosphate acyltransferase PlsX [Acidobacteriota bacterium]|jgi:glycerol-3-phosphate acyltransferase PlsX|nr:phosphate acyltransferase PlsX [Acidobacteriota bacterium]
MSPVRIAVDAMGGDHAPAVVIEGVVDYIRENSRDENYKIVLVGKEKEIQKELKKYRNVRLDRLEIVDALEEISMKEQFLSYWRKREQTSIKKAIDLVKNGKAMAMVSAGNTGAVMALAKNGLGSMKNVDRPALAIMLPTLKGSSLLVDVGANTDSKPHNLVEFALMGKIYLENIVGIKNPRIGLMNIGEEEVKGNELAKSTYNLLKQLDINFIGNVEGRDVYIGEADLIVTDGFTGNVTLKVSEGVVEVMLSMLKREIMSNIFSKIGFFFLKHSLKRIKKKLDYSEYGGALLLGVNGIVIIGHGGSNAKAIKNAISLSYRSVTEKVLDKISREIGRMQETLKELKYV